MSAPSCCDYGLCTKKATRGTRCAEHAARTMSEAHALYAAADGSCLVCGRSAVYRCLCKPETPEELARVAAGGYTLTQGA